MSRPTEPILDFARVNDRRQARFRWELQQLLRESRLGASPLIVDGRAGPTPAARELVRQGWDLDALGQGYRDFLTAFVPLDRAARKAFDPKRGVGAYLVRRAQEHGLILRVMGGDMIAFSPPLIITEAQIAEMMSRFARALDDTASWLSGV